LELFANVVDNLNLVADVGGCGLGEGRKVGPFGVSLADGVMGAGAVTDGDAAKETPL
jgi:hypothetical protein